MEKVLQVAQNVANQLSGLDYDDDDHEHFVIENQDGFDLNLPKEDKRALILAMTLHEKGITEFENGNLDIALKLLLAADSAFMEL